MKIFVTLTNRHGKTLKLDTKEIRSFTVGWNRPPIRMNRTSTGA